MAIPIEIVSGEASGVRGNAPRVFRHVGTRNAVSGRDCERGVARRLGWASAASVLELWTPALAVFEFQQANKKAIDKLKGLGKNNLFKPKEGKSIRRCKRFDLKGIPCKRPDCCSLWPCHDWEELLAAEARAGGLAKTVYAKMPDYIRSGRHTDLYSNFESEEVARKLLGSRSALRKLG